MDYDLSAVFENLGTLRDKDVQLIHYVHKSSGSAYQCSRIKYRPESELDKVIEGISDKYSKILHEHSNIEEYEGQCFPDIISHLDTARFIQDDFKQLMTQIASPEIIDDFPNEQTYNAMLISGDVHLYEASVPVKLISIHKPVSVLKRSIWEKNAFVFKNLKILNLPHDFEVLVLGSKDLYLMNPEGEKLFNLERSFKIESQKIVRDIIKMDFLSDGKVFETYASSGRCPRRLIAYNEKTVKKIAKNFKFRSKVSKKFGIELNGDNKLCITSKEDAEKMIDILCDRATTDFFDDDKPVQVERKKAWSTRT